MLKVTNIKDKVSRQRSGFTPTLSATLTTDNTTEMENKLHTVLLLCITAMFLGFYNISNQKQDPKSKLMGWKTTETRGFHACWSRVALKHS